MCHRSSGDLGGGKEKSWMKFAYPTVFFFHPSLYSFWRLGLFEIKKIVSTIKGNDLKPSMKEFAKVLLL